MSKQQRFPVAPPLKSDTKSEDFAQVIQQNFEDLFDVSHSHLNRTTAPSSSEGSVNDILPVNLNGVVYLYVKFPDPLGWKRFGPGA